MACPRVPGSSWRYGPARILMQARGELTNLFQSLERAVAPRSSISRKKSASEFLTGIHKATDVSIGVASVLTAFVIANLGSLPGNAAGFLTLRISVKNVLFTVIYAVLWSSMHHGFGVYKSRRLNWDAMRRVAGATTVASAFSVIFVVTSRSGAYRLSTVLLGWIIALSLSIVARMVFSTLTGPTTLSKHRRHILIVGTGGRTLRLLQRINGRANTDYHILGFVDSNHKKTLPPEIEDKLLGELPQLEDVLKSTVVDEVLITLPVKSCYSQIQEAISVCERVGVEAKYFSEIFQPSLANADYERMEGLAVTSLKPVVDDVRFIVKRAIDIFGASLGLISLSPLLLVIAISIKLTTQGPVFFTQQRHGRNRRRFRMYKFRTMVHAAEELQPLFEDQNEVSGPVFKIKNDPRLTRIGTVLRRTSLDELPQLINVLKGEMSLVGPRPLPQRDVSRFEEGWLLRRFCVLPGLTGLWQISSRGDARFEEWVQKDFEYIDNWSLRLDLAILLKTIPAVMKGTGAA